MPDALVRAELLELVYARQWADVDQLYQQLKFWHREPAGSQANLLDWADALALQQLPKNPHTPGPDGHRVAASAGDRPEQRRL